MEAVDTISSLWPIAISFVTLVIVLATMHADIQTLKQKVTTLFELINRLRDRD